MERTAIYARVSTDRQTVKNQILQLEKIAENNGWEIVKIYTDKGISGSKGRSQRPGLDELIKDATRRKFDRIMVWSIDRLARSVVQTATFMVEMDGLGITQFYYQQGIQTDTPYGKAMIQMSAVFAELEQGMIRERIMAGLARAKAQGKILGKKPMSENKKQEVINLKLANPAMTVRAIREQTGVSIGKISGILRAVAR